MLARNLELMALLLDLAEQPSVLNGDHRLRREGLQQVNRAFGEFTWFPPPHDERAHDAIGAQERDHQQGAIALTQHHL